LCNEFLDDYKFQFFFWGMLMKMYEEYDEFDEEDEERGK
jgi:hypothetical protein